MYSKIRINETNKIFWYFEAESNKKYQQIFNSLNKQEEPDTYETGLGIQITRNRSPIRQRSNSLNGHCIAIFIRAGENSTTSILKSKNAKNIDPSLMTVPKIPYSESDPPSYNRCRDRASKLQHLQNLNQKWGISTFVKNNNFNNTNSPAMFNGSNILNNSLNTLGHTRCPYNLNGNQNRYDDRLGFSRSMNSIRFVGGNFNFGRHDHNLMQMSYLPTSKPVHTIHVEQSYSLSRANSQIRHCRSN